MTNDLFLSAKDRLWEWMKVKKMAKTSEILKWGVTEGFSNRADRNARALATEGKLRRLRPEKKALLFGNISEEVWEVIRFPHSPITVLKKEEVKNEMPV